MKPASEATSQDEELVHAPFKTYREKANWLRYSAVAMGNLGYKVIRLRANTKRRAFKRENDQPSNDPELLYSRWSDVLTGEALDYNVGIDTGASGLAVLDYDVKNDPEVLQKEAIPLVKRMAALGTPPAIVVTPSGGWHLYFLQNPDCPIGMNQSRIATAVDHCGTVGLVVAPGSIINGKMYWWGHASLGK